MHTSSHQLGVTQTCSVSPALPFTCTRRTNLFTYCLYSPQAVHMPAVSQSPYHAPGRCGMQANRPWEGWSVPRELQRHHCSHPLCLKGSQAAGEPGIVCYLMQRRRLLPAASRYGSQWELTTDPIAPATTNRRQSFCGRRRHPPAPKEVSIWFRE